MRLYLSNYNFRQTDDVRIASGQNMGSLIQYISTFLACFITALVVSYQLTFVVLAGFPIVLIVTVITERFASPLIERDRDLTAQAANRIRKELSTPLPPSKLSTPNLSKRARSLPLPKNSGRL